jgi:hypothetical protein
LRCQFFSLWIGQLGQKMAKSPQNLGSAGV